MITINNFQQGQSSSPYLTDGAFAKSCNLDIFSQEGMTRINYLPTAGSASPNDIITNFSKKYSSTTNFYAADASSYVYSIDPTTSPHTITPFATTVGQYIFDWKGYLLGFPDGSSVIKYWNGTAWASLSGLPSFVGATNHFYLHAIRDGKIYFCSENNIGVLEEVSGSDFDPTNSSTFQWTYNAFNIPENFQAAGLSELGKYIVIAAISHEPVTNLEQKNPITSYLFWNGSDVTADYIFEIPEKRMTNLLSIGGTIFVSGGERGKIYTITESGVQLYAQIPFDYDSGKNILLGGLGYPSMAWWRDMLLVGVSNTSAGGFYPTGIYGIKGGKIVHQFLTSEQLDGSLDNIIIGAIYPYDETSFYFGWKNATDSTYGIDKVSTSGYRFPSYSSYFESIVYQVGTFSQKKSIDRIEVVLSRALQTGEGVRIKYRKSIDDSWTTLGTRDYSSCGAVSSLLFNGIHNLYTIQIRVELTTGSSSANTPYLLSVNLI